MDFLAALRDAVDTARISVPELARRAGVSRTATYRILSGETSPRLTDLEELFVAAGASLQLDSAPLHDLKAAAAARIVLEGRATVPADLELWVERLTRPGYGDAIAVVSAAANASSVRHDPDAIGLHAHTWNVDRLVSAGRASQRPWALSGWAALNAMGVEVDAPTIFWADDTRLIRQLLADSMSTISLEQADIILTQGDAHIFDHSTEVEAVSLVDPPQALVDAVGLGGPAEEAALNLIRSTP